MPLDAYVGVISKESPHPEAARNLLRELTADPEIRLALARRGIRPLTANAEVLARWREAMGERSSRAVDLSLEGMYVEETADVAGLVAVLEPYFRGEMSLTEGLKQAEAVKP